MKRFLKVGVVVVGALIMTALSIDAADSLSHKNGTLLSNLVGSAAPLGCPQGMVSVHSPTMRCVDMYEASPNDNCPKKNPANVLDTKQNTDVGNCSPQSVSGAQPWTNTTRDQATLLCTKAGKRLPTNAEWYQAALGSPDPKTGSECNIDSDHVRVSSESACKSSAGAYDMVGNAWEWVSEDVIDGVFNGRKVPESGYVDQIDAAGVAVKSASSENELFNADYFWSKDAGAFGMMRGGFYGSKSDAGIYTLHAYTLPTTGGAAIGFRCVQ